MPETDKPAVGVLPANVFSCTIDGLARWRAETDGLAVHPVLGGVLITAWHGETSVALTVAAVQARHLAEILIAASGLLQQEASE